jgi:hypothetical protein
MMKKINLNKPFLIFFLLLFILLLLFPKSSKAFVGTGIFDYFNTALEGVEESSAPVARRIFKQVIAL